MTTDTCSYSKHQNKYQSSFNVTISKLIPLQAAANCAFSALAWIATIATIAKQNDTPPCYPNNNARSSRIATIATIAKRNDLTHPILASSYSKLPIETSTLRSSAIVASHPGEQSLNRTSIQKGQDSPGDPPDRTGDGSQKRELGFSHAQMSVNHHST